MQSFMAANRADYSLLAKLSQGTRPNQDLSKRGADLGRGPQALSKLPAAAWSNTWPAPASTLDLDFANNRGWVRGYGQGGAMDAVTFTRASSGNWVDSTGTLRTGAGSFTGTANALGANLISAPQDFDNAYWTKTNSTVLPNTYVAPDGTITADALYETTANGSHAFVSSSITPLAVTYTASCYVKANGRSWIQISGVSGNTFAAYFNLSGSGSVGTVTSGVSASISDAGNGWYRCILTKTISSPVAGTMNIVTATADNTNTFVGDPSLGIIVWGAQLEVGSSATTYYPTNINAPRFDWASTTQLPQNLLTYSEQFQQTGSWTTANITVSADATQSPTGTNTADKLVPTAGNSVKTITQAFNVTSGLYYTLSCYVKNAGVTSGYIILQLNGDVWNSITSSERPRLWVNLANMSFGSTTRTIAYSLTNVGNDWYRLSITAYCSAVSTLGGAVAFSDTNGGTTFTGDATNGAYVWGAQLEIGTSATTYIPTTSAASAPTTPLIANSTCNGLLIEESRTNRALWCRDATQSNWTKTNITAAKTATGIDGVANAASTLTAGANNGTCIQQITLASGSRTASVYLKRISGTGNVQVTLDGSTWSTVDLSNGLWNRIVLSGTVTNPCVGVLLATSGDVVALDYAQIEDGAFVTSPILTTTATATRSADVASISAQNLSAAYNPQQGLFALLLNTFLPSTANNNSALSFGASGSQLVIYPNTGQFRSYDGTNVLSQNVSSFNVLNKITSGYYPNYKTISINGSVTISGPFANTWALNLALNLGSNGQVAYLNGWLNRLIYLSKKQNENATQNLSSQTL